MQGSCWSGAERQDSSCFAAVGHENPHMFWVDTWETGTSGFDTLWATHQGPKTESSSLRWECEVPPGDCTVGGVVLTAHASLSADWVCVQGVKGGGYKWREGSEE